MGGKAMSAEASWPRRLSDVFERSLTCEFATLTRRGTPVTWPVNPYLSPDRATIDLSTGLTYPAKAERARRDPRVALLFADPVGSGLEDPPVVLVKGHAAVRDRDLQAGADRYVASAMQKLAPVYRYTPWLFLKRQSWYLVRAWIEVTPLEITWWPGRDLAEPPQRWKASLGSALPESDPPPTGKSPGAYQGAPRDWSRRARQALRLGAPDLTVVGADGWPLAVPATAAAREQNGFRIALGPHLPEDVGGPACLSFHSHGEEFRGQENVVFVGTVTGEGDSARFTVERALGDFSLGGNRLSVSLAFFQKARRLRPRLDREVARRGQPMPEIRRLR